MKKIEVKYYAALREQRGVSFESLETDARTLKDLYRQLQNQHCLALEIDHLKVAVNNEYRSWDHLLQDGDDVIFLPPVNGG